MGNPEAELAPAFQTIGPVLEKFVSVDPLLVPTGDGKDSGIFVTKSYDASSHFETTCLDILDVYKRCMGEELDLDTPRKPGGRIRPWVFTSQPGFDVLNSPL